MERRMGIQDNLKPQQYACYFDHTEKKTKILNLSSVCVHTLGMYSCNESQNYLKSLHEERVDCWKKSYRFLMEDLNIFRTKSQLKKIILSFVLFMSYMKIFFKDELWRKLYLLTVRLLYTNYGE